MTLIRIAALAAFLALSACSDPHALTYVDASSPGWNLNPDHWNDTTNQITETPAPNVGSQGRHP